MGLHKIHNVLFLKGNWMRYGFTVAKMCVVKDLMKENCGRPFFVCGEVLYLQFLFLAATIPFDRLLYGFWFISRRFIF
jgi:hypothetical protein